MLVRPRYPDREVRKFARADEVEIVAIVTAVVNERHFEQAGHGTARTPVL
jgi:hypothetical protein